MKNPRTSAPSPDWSLAPEGWHWAAQDEDGRWFWYRTEPIPGIGGGVWRAHSKNQQYACQGSPNPDWFNSLQHRPGARPLPESDGN